MGSSSVWGNIRGFTVTEYVRSRDSGIFRRWWAKVVSPYTYWAWRVHRRWGPSRLAWDTCSCLQGWRVGVCACHIVSVGWRALVLLEGASDGSS